MGWASSDPKLKDHLTMFATRSLFLSTSKSFFHWNNLLSYPSFLHHTRTISYTLHVSCAVLSIMPIGMQRLKLKKYSPGDPGWMVGKPLLVASSALASLSDTMFDYSQGIIASVQVQPKFIERFYGIRGTTLQDIQAGINPNIQGMYAFSSLHTLVHVLCTFISYHGILPEHNCAYSFPCRCVRVTFSDAANLFALAQLSTSPPP